HYRRAAVLVRSRQDLRQSSISIEDAPAVIGGNPGPDLSDGRFPQTAGLGRPSSAARHGESHGHDFNPLVGGDRYRRTLHRLRVAEIHAPAVRSSFIAQKKAGRSGGGASGLVGEVLRGGG